MKEEEIRPKEIFDEYLRLAANDVETFFGDVKYVMTDCPACGKKGVFAFHKQGFNYDECPECKTLFVNPRPQKEAFDNYYNDSPSTKYWATTFYKTTEEARREKLWKPKAIMVQETIKMHAPEIKYLVDIGGGYGTFIEEFNKISDLDTTVIEPSVHLSEVCRGKGLNVVQKFVEEMTFSDLKDLPKCLVSFELFEHLHDPSVFVNAVKNLMKSGDLFYFTTLSGIGVDIRALWEDSKSVSPPHHLNFLNPKSVRILLEHLGLEVIEVKTPGKLDISIMENSRDKLKDRFWRTFVESASVGEKNSMQEYLVNAKLSSHMTVLCRKS